jgi:chloramphenicol O-acetyltransferase type A
MSHYLDLSSWPRRDQFEFFRKFDKPYFNLCTRVSVTELVRAHRAYPDVSPSLACHYFALRVANEIEPFRYRLRGDQVLVYDVINGGTTVLLPNEAFTLAYFDYNEDFAKFMQGAKAALDEVRAGDGAFRPKHDDDARIHFTILPWVSFTSFSHARNWGREDSVPKIAFGKFTKENDQTFLPISVEVHHALADGLHVGRYLNRFEELLGQAEAYLSSANIGGSPRVQ